jgi:hydroxymethylglutaryl-CoA lyase
MQQQPTGITYVECPRDSWQGYTRLIPTEQKRRYLQRLLQAGFRHLDLGSFVSPKAVPQMADTEAVLAGLERPQDADFLCIIANERGLERALSCGGVTSVGYPLSVNDTFQRRNTNRSLAESWPLVKSLREQAGEKRLVMYLSMGFGNPYGEPWSPQDTATAVVRLRDLGVHDIALADTVGTATPERLTRVLEAVVDAAVDVGVSGLGLHLHASPGAWRESLKVALDHGIRWLEGALGGIGGCPFADDALVGNLPTEEVLPWLMEQGFKVMPDMNALSGLRQQAGALRSMYE